MGAEKDGSPCLVETPLIFPSRISHRRFQPKQHAFAYSYLTVGIPIGWTGCSNGFLSVDVPPGGARGWLHVDAADHLSRATSSTDTLRSKLDAYLASQGVNPTAYPHAFLVCQPTVLRYQFNPASFWHLYSADLSRKAMIVEVNNTFDERRMYFLDSDKFDHEEASREPSRLRTAWKKDFHVSPFNSRLGSYSLTSHDPLRFPSHEGGELGPNVGFDNTITLSTSDGSPKLVARIWSVQRPLDPRSMSALSKIRLLRAWWWVGLVTFPRIVYEAFRLYFTHKLHVWYRPEVLPTSSGRTPTNEERIIEKHFRAYLRHTVSIIPLPISVVYHPPQAFGSEQSESFHSDEGEKDVSRQITLSISTPEFFKRIVHYDDTITGLSQEILDPEIRNRTGWSSDENSLAEILGACISVEVPGQIRCPSSTTLNIWIHFCERLRTAPADMSYPWPAVSHPKGKAPPRASQSQLKIRSSLDKFVLGCCNQTNARDFFRSKALIFASERYALGSVSLLWIELFAFVLVLASFGPLCALTVPAWHGIIRTISW